ncbi:hypothetical protein FRC08_002746 [Ceratobasidium sp. 394]|nr:hypothetical protein FRC08_002746 [Ceratobasidium sp. 394]
MNVQEHPKQPDSKSVQRTDSVGSVTKSGLFDDRDNKATPIDEDTAHEQREARPPLDYSSFGAFSASLAARLRSILTRRFILSLLGGQLVSICITCTSVTTTELVNRGWALPTTQTFFLYFALFAVYTPYTIYQYGFKGWGNVILKDGWKYFILAACDVEGNFLVVKAYEYTNLLSCMLLDA